MSVIGHILLVSILTATAGCVGIGVVNESVESYPKPPFALEREVGYFVNDDYKYKDWGRVLAKTKNDVLALWGEPAKRITNGSSERWFYSRELGWSGLLPVVIVPIPLLVPIGYRETILVFDGDTLTAIEKKRGRERVVICGVIPQGHNMGLGCDVFR